MCTIVKNEKWNSYELTFDGKPSEEIRTFLKANGYRWNRTRGIWFGYVDITEQLQKLNPEASPEHSETEKTTEPKAKATAIKFYYNGIKIDGSDELIKCGYYFDRESACVNMYQSGYGGDLPRDLFDVKNDTDVYTDYFDSDRTTISPEHPLYKYAAYAAKKAQYMSDKRTLKAKEKNPNLYIPCTLEELKERVKAFEQLPDVGQPTNADLLKIDELNRKAEEERKVQEEAEKRKEENNFKAKKACGEIIIKNALNLFPLSENEKDYVLITGSEHCGFYDILDKPENKDGLKMSIIGANFCLRQLDDLQHTTRETENGFGYYDKTDFTIFKDGEPVYEGRYDLGDGESGLLAHISIRANWNATHERNGKEKSEMTETDKERLAFVEWLKGFCKQEEDEAEDVESLDIDSAEYQAYFS